MNTALEQPAIDSKDGTTETAVRCTPLPSPQLRRDDWPVLSLPGDLVAACQLFFAHERVGLGKYVFVSAGAAAFCSGLCGLAVTSVFETAVPRWFILAYGVSCVLLSLLAPVLCRSRQQIPPAGQPHYGLPTDADATAFWAGFEKEKEKPYGGNPAISPFDGPVRAVLLRLVSCHSMARHPAAAAWAKGIQN
jgi:hypothetical protein